MYKPDVYATNKYADTMYQHQKQLCDSYRERIRDLESELLAMTHERNQALIQVEKLSRGLER